MMDPVTGAIVAIVLFFVSIPVLWWLASVVGMGVGALIGDDAAPLAGAAVGWLLGAGWAVFALIQLILQIVHLVELLN